jgi:hypothetical protein
MEERYRIEEESIADPQRDVVLQRTRFVPLQGTLADYHLYVLLVPHLGNRGAGNAAGLGARRVPQAAPLAARRACFRYTFRDSQAISRDARRRTIHDLALQSQSAHDDGWEGSDFAVLIRQSVLCAT